MNFSFSEEQGQIRDSIDRFVAENYAFAQRNAVVDMAHGFSTEHWQQFAELGWLSIPFSEVHGGFGGGPGAERIIILHAGARGEICNAGRIGQANHLVAAGSGCVLRDHQSALQTGLWSQKRRQFCFRIAS